MRLQKALKLKKKLTGDIAKLKVQIMQKNSYMEGSLNAEKYNVPKLYEELLEKINQLVGLKFAINQANLEIQSKIYLLAEYKGLVEFWKSVNVTEGEHPVSGRFGDTSVFKNYVAQISEEDRDKFVKTYEEKIEAIQDEIDTYNFTTDIPWEEAPEVEEK